MEMTRKKTMKMTRERKELAHKSRKLSKKAKLREVGNLSKLRLLKAILHLFRGFLKALNLKGPKTEYVLMKLRALGHYNDRCDESPTEVYAYFTLKIKKTHCYGSLYYQFRLVKFLIPLS